MVKSNFLFNRKGITIIELLVVVAIMVIMSALVLPRLLSSNVRKEFDSTVETIFYSLNQARERATAWEKGTTWGVFLKRAGPSPCASQPHFGIFFTNSGYDEADKINYVSYLPATMDFDVTSTWGANAPGNDCYRIIDFKEVTGERWFPDPAVSTSSVKVYIIKNPAVSSTISVTSLGVISYTTSSDQ